MFQVPNYDPKDSVNRFAFTVPRRWPWQRSKFSFPFLQFVPLEVMREAKSAEKPLQLVEILNLIREPAAAKAVTRLNQPEVAALEHAWLEASAVGLGESSASSNSSTSSERPSQPTSTPSVPASTT